MKFSLTNFIKYYLLLYFVVLGIMYYLRITVTVYFIIFDVLAFALVFIEYMNRNIKANNLLIYLFAIYLFVATISIIINDTGIFLIIKRIRFVMYPLLFLFLLQHKKLNVFHYRKIHRLLFYFGYIQGPVAIFQKIIYPYLPLKFRIAEFVDYASGTIGGINSSLMSSFMVALLFLKVQEGITYGFSTKKFFQIVLLLSPIFVVESIAQFIFIPLILLYTLKMNRMLKPKHIAILLFSFAIFLFLLNLVLPRIGNMNIIENLSILSLYFADAGKYASGEAFYFGINRISQMIYLFSQPTSFFGHGLGTFFEPYSFVTNLSGNPVIALNNQILVTYAETGLIGLVALALIPLYTFVNAKTNNYNAKLIKLLSFQILIGCIYTTPIFSFHIMFLYIFHYVININKIDLKP